MWRCWQSFWLSKEHVRQDNMLLGEQPNEVREDKQTLLVLL